MYVKTGFNFYRYLQVEMIALLLFTRSTSAYYPHDNARLFTRIAGIVMHNSLKLVLPRFSEIRFRKIEQFLKENVMVSSGTNSLITEIPHFTHVVLYFNKTNHYD